MPLDDLRPSKRRGLAPPWVEVPEENRVAPEDWEPPPTVEEQEAYWEEVMVEVRRRVADLKAGRTVALPWDDAMNERIFGKLR